MGRSPGAVPGLDARGDRDRQPVIADLLKQHSVHMVKDEAAVPALLTDRDLQPAAQPAAPGPVVSVHRSDADDTDFYWLYI
ncbi:hypothetical protein [Streptomyces sp. NPDC090083]|uniref:hypothetical protein n=1 Tax=Streptomyces sp. NPDC090083 TaxID=3365941 RepID=UPI003819386F